MLSNTFSSWQFSAGDFVEQSIFESCFCIECNEISFPPARCGECNCTLCPKCSTYTGGCLRCSCRHYIVDKETEEILKDALIICSNCEGTWTGTVESFERHIKRECGAKDFHCPLFALNCCSSECTGLIYEFNRSNHIMQAGQLQHLEEMIASFKAVGITESSSQGLKLVAMESLRMELVAMENLLNELESDEESDLSSLSEDGEVGGAALQDAGHDQEQEDDQASVQYIYTHRPVPARVRSQSNEDEVKECEQYAYSYDDEEYWHTDEWYSEDWYINTEP